MSDLPPEVTERTVSDVESQLPSRVSNGIGALVFRVLCTGITLLCLAFVLDVSFILEVSFFREQYFGALYGFVFAAAFLRLPIIASHADRPVPIYDWALAALGMGVGMYLALNWATIVMYAGFILPTRTYLGLATTLIILELTRRAFGFPLVVVATVFIAYGLFRDTFPGAFGGRAITWERMVNFVYTDTEAMMGIIAVVVFGMVFAFLLFGRALFLAGGGKFFTDMSISVMGHRRGGPAKVAVIASSIFGTLSGSASSSVVVTGAITIPMMIRAGYHRASAAAIEAVSSSGGGLMPPVMGATAFIMAEFLAVPYHEIVTAALIPALLYFMTVFVQIDLEAGRLGLHGLKASEIPRFTAVLRAGWFFLVPLAALIYCLFVIFLSPSKSALLATAVVAAVSVLGASGFTWRKAWDTVLSTGNLMVEMGILAAIAGMIVGIISLSGLGLLFGQQLLTLAGGSVFMLLVLTAVASIIMGMSMPVTASYVILAVIAAPAIVQAGVPPMAAHLFIFYFAVLSFITPPVCVAIFVAATIARAKPMQAAGRAMSLAVVAFVVPFAFVYDQALIMDAAWYRVIQEVLFVVLAFVAIAVALQGYLAAPVSTSMRIALGVAGPPVLVPIWAVKLPAVAAVVALLVLVWVLGRRQQADPVVAGQRPEDGDGAADDPAGA